jgi:hypothetical protein
VVEFLSYHTFQVFLNNFQTALSAIKDAAAEVAKQNIQLAYKNATRIALNIEIDVMLSSSRLQ